MNSYAWTCEKHSLPDGGSFVGITAPLVRCPFCERVELIARVQMLEAALQGISAIRDSIVGAQTVNWSEHIYPLVAALEAAGFKGADYATSRKHLGTLIEMRAKLLEALKSLVFDTPRDVLRCEWCGWPLAASRAEGCVDDDCSRRPHPGQRRADYVAHNRQQRALAVIEELERDA